MKRSSIMILVAVLAIALMAAEIAVVRSALEALGLPLWQEFLAPIPPEERHDLLAAYHRRLTGALLALPENTKMSTTNGNGNGGVPNAQATDSPPQLNVLAQYVKDLSFENPRAPEALRQVSGQPQMDVGVEMNARGRDDDVGGRVAGARLDGRPQAGQAAAHHEDVAGDAPGEGRRRLGRTGAVGPEGPRHGVAQGVGRPDAGLGHGQASGPRAEDDNVHQRSKSEARSTSELSRPE